MPIPKKEKIQKEEKQVQESIAPSTPKFTKKLSPIELRKLSIDERKEYFRYMRDKERELVTGIFKFYEVPGGNLGFSIRLWDGDPVQDFVLQDGETYTIPLGVARHLNNNGWYPFYKHAPDEYGIVRQIMSQKVRRFGFQSLEFIDAGEYGHQDKQLITVENI